MPWSAKKRIIAPGDLVLVTGACGGVGRHIVRALLDAGCEVRAVDRRPPADPALRGLVDPEECDWIEGDLNALEPASLVEGAVAVIHAAAEVGLSETYEELADSNVEAVYRLVEAARAAGVKHFVHFGTGAVYSPGRGLRHESDPVEPGTDYERTKLHSEEEVQSSSGDMPWTILRPALIYGPHCESMSAGLVTLPPILRNFTRLLPGLTGGTRSSFVHVEDVAAAAMVVLGNEDAFGRVFNVSDDTPMGFGEALTATTEAYGFSVAPLMPFPSPGVLMAFSPVVDREYVASTVRKVLRQIWSGIQVRHGLETPLRPKVDRSVIFYVAEDTVLDNAALKSLGWLPKYRALTDGIAPTIRWYQDHGWVPRFDTETEVKLRDERATIGIGFEQRMTGSWQGGDVELTLQIELPRVSRADLSGHVDGTARFEGLGDEIPVEGTIEIGILNQQLSYEFGLDTESGAFRCRASAPFTPWRPFQSLDSVTGRLTDQRGRDAGVVTFNLEIADRLPTMLGSFRLL